MSKRGTTPRKKPRMSQASEASLPMSQRAGNSADAQRRGNMTSEPTIGSIDGLLRTELKQLIVDAQRTSDPAIAALYLRVGWAGLAAMELAALGPDAANEAFLRFAGRVRLGFGGLGEELGHRVNIKAIEGSGFQRTPLLGEFYRLAQKAHKALEDGGDMPAPESVAQAPAVTQWRKQVATGLTPRPAAAMAMKLTNAMPMLRGEMKRALDDGRPLIAALPAIPTGDLQVRILKLLLARQDGGTPASLTTDQIKNQLNYTDADGWFSGNLSALVKAKLLANDYHTPARRKGYRLTALGRKYAQRLASSDATAGASSDQ